MSTEQLIIELDARTAKLDAKLKATENRLNDLGEATSEADTRLGKFTFSAKSAAGVVITAGKALVVLASALTAMTLSSAKNRRELELLAGQAKTSTSDFQALSFATSKYGIDAEKIADISKDIADKIGEFSAAGTGAFQDYADVMKLSKDQAREAAQEFEGLSSQEILGKMVSRMEDASVSGDKMTFVLESLGSDASMLIPLFKGNSSELKELKKRFDDVNKSLQITGTQAEALRDVSNTFTLMTSSIGNATTAISATLAPVLDDFFNDIIDIVPDATQTIVNFINSFLDAENISSIAGVNKEIADGQERIDELTEKINSKRQRGKELIKADREIERERLVALKEQLEVLTQQEEKLENAKRLKGGEIGGEDGADLPEGGLGTGDEIQAIADRFKLEETLLAEKLARELEMVGENLELRRNLTEEYVDNISAIENKATKDKLKLDRKRHKTEQSLERQNISSIMTIISALVGHNSDVGKALFIGSQALAASEVFFNTQVASMKAVAQLGPIAGPPVAAGIQMSGNLSIAAIAATTLGSLSSSGGGGGGGGGSISPPSQQQPDFQPETSSLEFTDTTDTGQTTFNLTVPDGDEIGQALANWINKAQTEGRT